MSRGEIFFPRTLYITGESCYSGHNRNRGGSGKEGKMQDTTVIQYKLPGTFFEDHMTRFFGEGVWEDHNRDSEVWSKRQVTVCLNDDQMYHLLSDAQFYASGGGDFYPPSDYRGIINSAKATVRSIEKQGGFDD